MDKILDRKSFEVGGHWPLWRERKNRMTRQNRQKSNAKKKCLWMKHINAQYSSNLTLIRGGPNNMPRISRITCLNYCTYMNCVCTPVKTYLHWTVVCRLMQTIAPDCLVCVNVCIFGKSAFNWSDENGENPISYSHGTWLIASLYNTGDHNHSKLD